MEQHRIKDEAARKLETRHFSILDLGGDGGGGGGSRFSICFFQQCSFRETSFSKNTLAIGATEIESTVSLPTSIVFFCIQVVYAHSSIQAPVESNKLNNKYERFGWWNYPRRNF